MIRLLGAFLLMILLPAVSVAQPVKVTSGEHDGFTRLVLDYGAPVVWQVGRTSDGYELRLSGAKPTYDLTGVFEVIARRRLASVWAEPESGALRIGIGCACHAQPFEFRAGIVVIDLKDGPPPKSSSFEAALDGGTPPGLVDKQPARPRARPAQQEATSGVTKKYNWIAAASRTSPVLVLPEASEMTKAETDPVTLTATDPDLQPLREVLLQQLSRGAAQGVVDMADPTPSKSRTTEATSVRVRLETLPGVQVNDQDKAPIGVTAAGATCPGDDEVSVQDWADDRPVAEQMPEAMAGLTGEFDAPDPTAQGRAVRFLISIGFGAEARQILAQLPVSLPDAPLLTSLAHIVDGSQDPNPAFAGMAACDGAAALWALLTTPAPLKGASLDRAAVLRSFSALPVHLRRHIGPELAARLVALDDMSAAQNVRDAILRAPGDAGPDVALMEARLDLGAGDAEQAEHRAETLITNSGPATPEALITLVEARLALRQPIESAQITALEGLLHERDKGPDAARYAHALTLARALAGDFDGAFGDLAGTPEATAEVWGLLAELGPDSALLTHAVIKDAANLSLPAEVANELARRLSDLGFASAAQVWLTSFAAPDKPIAARIALQSGDARTALRLMDEADDPSLLPMRIEALRQLGEEETLAALLAGEGDETGRWQAVSRTRDWSQLAKSGPVPWKDVAAAAVGVPTAPVADGSGPLAQGNALLEGSAATRQAVTDLLAGIPTPGRTDP